MSDSPVDLDLKFLPDWLKESSAGNRYADYEGDSGDRPRRDDRGGRPGGGERRGGPPAGRRDGPGGDRRGPRPGGGGPQRSGGPGGPRPGGPGGPRPGGRRPEGGRDDRRFENREPRQPQPPQVRTPDVRVEFIPEPNCVAGIAKQIRSSFRAYPLFGTARLFLEKPERHRVRITTLDATVPLFQCGDGPVSFDRESVEREAFRHLKEEYYSEEQVQGEPPKGNYTNVARSRTTGTFLGPTNYHGYQPALRKLYEERFSRRMSFPDFLRDEIQILNNEQAVADWKEQARSSTTYSTKQEAEPITFKTPAEVEAHFRQNYLPKLVKSGTTLETSGHASRAINERGILNALRDTWEKERGFPQSLVNLLRPHLVESGLHFFKHRKRILYVTPIRPQRHAAGEVFSEGIASILTIVGEHPKITRPQLATRLLGEGHDAPEALPRKAALASDLHYLIQSGHVIEFHDGTLDLPLAPNAKPEPEGTDEPRTGGPAASQSAAPEQHAPAAHLASDSNTDAEASSGETQAIAESAPEQISEPAPTSKEEANEEMTAPAPDGTPEEPPIVIEVHQTASDEGSGGAWEPAPTSAHADEEAEAVEPANISAELESTEGAVGTVERIEAADDPSQESADAPIKTDETAG